MKAKKVCRECLIGHARRTASHACGENLGLAALAEREAVAFVEENFTEGITIPPQMANGFLSIAARVSGNPDPYFKFKRLEFEMSQKLLPLVEARCAKDLRGRLKLSAMGNRLDFFRPLQEVEKEWAEVDFEFSDEELSSFESALLAASKILLLADNTGEALFDAELIKFLEGEGKEVAYCVKGAPSQNDLTRADIARFGIEIKNLVDTGTGSVGIWPDESGEEFHQAFALADLVISKGMANLETLSEFPDFLKGKPLFFLLCVKCETMAEFLDKELGSEVLISSKRFCP